MGDSGNTKSAWEEDGGDGVKQNMWRGGVKTKLLVVQAKPPAKAAWVKSRHRPEKRELSHAGL